MKPHRKETAHRFYALDEGVVEVHIHEPAPDTDDVPEVLVHDIWANRYFDQTSLTTLTGDPVCILDPGRANPNSGPDFLCARLRVGDLTWCGDVEIHLASSQWVEHGHRNDPRYNGVVLHVALNQDLWSGTLKRFDDTLLPEVILINRLQSPLRSLLWAFYHASGHPVHCSDHWHLAPDEVKTAYVGTLAHERLINRQTIVAAEFHAGATLDEILHQRVFQTLGFSKNGDAMHVLAERLPIAVCRGIRDRMDLEALHFGVAGLIPRPKDLLQSDRETADYSMELSERFDRLTAHLDVRPMDPLRWRFFRLRPANFPTLRIAQAVSLLQGFLTHFPIRRLRKAAVAQDALPRLRQPFETSLPAYWDTHVRLDRASRLHPSAIGRERTDAILANAVAPILLFDALSRGDAHLQEAVFGLLDLLPADPDEITRLYSDLGQRCRTATDAQGLHQLFRSRCSASRCLSCDIGKWFLSEGTVVTAPSGSLNVL